MSYYQVAPSRVYASTIAADARVLLFSQRNIELPTWHVSLFEFEDVVAEVDAVQMLAPLPASLGEFARVRRRIAHLSRQALSQRGFGELPPFGIPVIQEMTVDRSYDLFFGAFHFAWQLAYLERIKSWRAQCRTAVCFLVELWKPWVAKSMMHLRLLEQFDHVFVFSRWCMPDIQAFSDCSYLPMGVDAQRFAPGSPAQNRPIDVYSYGRHSPAAHPKLTEMMEAGRLTYIYDTFSAGNLMDYLDHRRLTGALMKRSRFFMVNRMNDEPSRLEYTGGEEALSTRYFEGTAGGAVLVGSAPGTPDFRINFPWDDAVIPFDGPGDAIVDLLAELEAQPDRLRAIRRIGVVHALRRHDWAYRWQEILATIGLAPLQPLAERSSRLEAMAAEFDTGAP